MNDQIQAPGRDERRKQEIVEAAARLFAEKGFAGSSNRAIAQEAGISPGLIYWYFRDKDELFMAVLQSLFPLRGLEIPDPNELALPLAELLSLIGTRFMEIMAHPDTQKLIRIVLGELISFPDLTRQVGQMIAAQAIDRLASLLDDQIAQGAIPPIDTRLAAQSFFGSLIGWILRKHIFQSDDLADIPDESMIETVVRLHAGGLTASSPPN